MGRLANAARRRSTAPALLTLVLAGSACTASVGPSAYDMTAHAAPSDGYAVRDYLAYAGRMQRHFDSLWDPRAGRYRPGGGSTETAFNANLLIVHAVAAAHGDRGPARDDGRARRIVSWLTEGDVFVERVPRGAGDQGHAPGWVPASGSPIQHLVFDSEPIDGLMHAYDARVALGLSDRAVRVIRDRIHRVVSGPFWRWPAIRLNQFNWYALAYAADATVTGEGRTLARGLRAHLVSFLDGVRPGASPAGNLGPGLRFHYLPHRPVEHRMNVDSAEYASIVMSFARFYEQARAAGMPPLRGRRLALMREWVRRSLAGYWTHGGYLNWDTGLGFKRWHQNKKFGLAQRALLGLAGARDLQPDARYAMWAKHLLDRSFDFYDRLTARARGIPDGVLFGVRRNPQVPGAARLGAARVSANAARAAASGLGERPSSTPPSLYSFDPDTGRLAVTTPAYSTAIVPVNQGAFPYGGIELARLFDGGNDVAAGIGGRPPAAFGLLARAHGGGRVLSTQVGFRTLSRAVTPLKLTEAPEGVGVSAATTARRSFAGPFRRLRTIARVRRAGVVATVRHSFTPEAIETRWALTRRSGRPLDVDVRFPSWGRSATVVAEDADGRRVRIGWRPLSLARVARLIVTSRHASYSVIPLRRRHGATARLLPTGYQASAPTPGPTLAVAIARGSSARRLDFAARIVVEDRRGNR